MVEATVFSNGLSVACKAFDGKSVAAFPDPCWTYPAPPSGPIVIPFSNSAYSKDTANGSKTVFIAGKPIMLKDQSYFKTSYGNEAADFAKGLMSGVKKGKAYFSSWSMDIKVEGFNVCRHSDLMTHNHGSQPGNTSVWVYTNRSGNKPSKQCFNDCVEIEKACGNFKKNECVDCIARARCGDGRYKSKENKNTDKDAIRKKGKLRKSIKNFLSKKRKAKFLLLDDSWKLEQCFPCALFKPGLDPKKQIECLTSLKKNIEKSFKYFTDEVWTMKNFKMILENAEILDVDITDLIPIKTPVKYFKLPKRIYKYIKELMRYERYKDIVEEIGRTLGAIYRNTSQLLESINSMENIIKNYENASTEDIERVVENCMQTKKCLRKRRCLLEPYKESKMPMALFSNQGCCPGQTAHHLIPNAMFQKDRGESTVSNISGCNRYDHDKAPTVCVEGVRQTIGSHKRIHENSKNNLEKYLRSSLPVTYKNVRIAVSEAFVDTFNKPSPGNLGVVSGCSKECIKQQLNEFMKKTCSQKLDTELNRSNGMDRTIYKEEEYCK